MLDPWSNISPPKKSKTHSVPFSMNCSVMEISAIEMSFSPLILSTQLNGSSLMLHMAGNLMDYFLPLLN